MSRVISQKNAPRERRQALKMATRALSDWSGYRDTPDQRDCAAFIVLVLEQIWQSVESTVSPWEKRGYWLKADKFRLEWSWVIASSRQICEALMGDNWAGVGEGLADLAEQLARLDVRPDAKDSGKSARQVWQGSWAVLQKRGCREGDSGV